MNRKQRGSEEEVLWFYIYAKTLTHTYVYAHTDAQGNTQHTHTTHTRRTGRGELLGNLKCPGREKD